MSDSLEQQLRDAFKLVDEQRTTVDISSLQERAVAEGPVRADQQPVPDTGESWPEFEDDTEESRPGLWDVLTRPRVFTAFMAVLAVPVAVVLILSSSDTEPPPRAERGSEPVASPGSAGDAPVATPAPAVSSLAWSRVPHDEAVFGRAGSKMRSVTAGGPGLVAVGDDKAGGDAAVWTATTED